MHHSRLRAKKKKKINKDWRFVFILRVQLSVGRSVGRASIDCVRPSNATTKTEAKRNRFGPICSVSVSSTYTNTSQSHTHHNQPVDVLRANDCDDRFCMEITFRAPLCLCSPFPPRFSPHFLDILKLSLVNWLCGCCCLLIQCTPFFCV